jgi:hypothetical protein
MTSDSFGFEKKSIKVEDKALFLFSRQAKFGMQEGIKMCEEPKHEIDACCRVQYCFGRWYILIPYKVEKGEKKAEEGLVGALDPGVRTFQAFYSEKEGEEIAPGIEKVARAMKKKIDGIRGRVAALEEEATQEEKGGNRKKSKSFRQKVKRVTKAWYRTNARAGNMVSDLHFFFRRRDVIVAPKLGVGRM